MTSRGLLLFVLLAWPIAGWAHGTGSDERLPLLGPAPAPMERRAGRYRAQVLLHAGTHSPLQKFMSAWLPALESLPEARRVRWSIDVDALDLA